MKKKIRYYLLIGIIIFVIGHLVDSISTIIALFYPPPGKQFVEVGNAFIILLMYNLNLGKMGFFVGDVITWIFEMFIIYYRAHHPSEGFRIVYFIFFLAIFGFVHWTAGIFNIMKLVS